TLTFEGFSAHPDLAGRLDDGETTFGVEAKGEDDLLRGIAQADLYRAGFHMALFASAGVPSADLVDIARRRGVGVLAVTPEEWVSATTWMSLKSRLADSSGCGRARSSSWTCPRATRTSSACTPSAAAGPSSPTPWPASSTPGPTTSCSSTSR